MRLLPVLKPSEWTGPTTGAHAHLWIGTPDDPQVYVGYAWENQDSLTYAPKPGPGAEGDEIVRLAFENLDKCEVGCELVEANGARVLVSAGHPFAAEQVLSERHMRSVHDQLGADDVVVSISKRGSMLACARDSGDEAKKTMVALHLEAWLGASQDDRITNQLIVFSAAAKTETMKVYGDGQVKDWT